MIANVTDILNERAITGWCHHLCAIGRAESTRANYTYYLRRFLRGRAFAAVTVDDVETWLAGHRWAPATRRNILGALGSFFGWAHGRALIECDPTEGITPPRTTAPCPKPTPQAVIDAALAREPDSRYWLVVAAVTTGLRRGELARLHSDQVELHADGYWLRIVGKGDRSRLVPCPEDVAAWLMDCHGWAFPSRRFPGRHELPPSVGKRLKRLLGGYSAHTLRHHYATAAYQQSGDLMATQQLLGHASPVTTIGYVQQDPARLRRAASAAWAS